MRHLVDDWKRAHHWLSLRLLVPAGTLDGAAMYLRASHPLCGQSLPYDLHMAAWALLWGALVGRLVRQKGPKPIRPTIPKNRS